MHLQPGQASIRKTLSVASLFVLLLNACSLSLLEIPGLNFSTATPSLPSEPTATPQPGASITFQVALPSPIQAGETLYLSVVDEVTGLGLNAVNYVMQGMDELHYTVAIPFLMNSVVKYRYLRQGTFPFMEDDSFDRPVRYRMYFVSGPGVVDDVVASWSDSLFLSPSGRLTGKVMDPTNNSPIPDILIAAGGQQTLTDATGAFVLENLPAGTHNVVAYAVDGSYQTVQQGARVEAGLRTPVALTMNPAQRVSVDFIVSVPANTIENAPIRLAGNLYQFGNTFGELSGGMSTVASRMLQLTTMQDGRYALSMSLPAGAEIRYKYTLGDGFWNAEHNTDGGFTLRRLVLPTSAETIQVEDTVETWQAGASSPILFEVNVPASTPVTDIVSIQFNPYGWTEPIPMWPRGNNQWVYQLYSPLNMLGDFEYRYCRNEQCGIADDVQTSAGHAGRLISTSLLPQDLQDTVTEWTWLQSTAPNSIVGLTVSARQNFMAGLEFMQDYNPTWQSWMALAIQDVQSRNANWLVIDPTWTVSQKAPFIFSAVPGLDPLRADTLETVSRARAANLKVALFPAARLSSDVDSWWKTVPGDAAWWDAWFERYAAFAASNADLAEKSGAQMLVLGGDWITPALPGGLIDGNSSGVPDDSGTRWQTIITDVRNRFHGSLYWALPYPGGIQSMPDFARSLDGLYLLWYAPFSSNGSDQVRAEAGQKLDADIQPIQSELQKPVILAVAYPSMESAAGELPPYSEIFQPGGLQAPVNLQPQSDIYLGLLMAVNERDWVGGFVSRGYYPPTVLQDASASIHGKPTADLLWYWYPRFLGIIP
jgi:hypothetical protein